MIDEKTISLTVDSRKRICISKLLDELDISSVKAYKSDGKIILEPMVEISANEVWLYKNKEALAKVRKGLSQEATISRGSFSKYIS